MDWLAFISSVISSIVWPVSIISMVYILRGQISRIITLIKRVQYKDIKIEFGENARELKANFAKSLPSTLTIDDRIPIEPEWRILADKSPRTCISQTYREMENAGVAAVQRRHPNLSIEILRKWSKVLAVLLEDKVIDKEKFYILRELRMLRNQVRHPENIDLTSDDAISYAEAALSAASYLRKV